ncbi:MAG: hypothetical protein H6818_21510 [Phycisphaerales bacterium]|nr:hypothetical protein [Phycisphaerales bacterium]MCB9862368.1 hypothetical protein [Phycisphaerales bacterium]
MRAHIPTICVALAIAVTYSTASASSFTVTDMIMGSQVIVDGDLTVDAIYVPTNPFAATHHAQMGQTESTTVYDLTWDITSGSFDYLFDHAIEDGPASAYARSSGTFIFSTTEDMVFSYNLDYSYSLSGSTFVAKSTFQLVEGTPSDNFLVDYFSAGGPGWLELPNGTMLTSGQEFLEAGRRYVVTYRTELSVSGQNTGLVRHGSGSLQFAFATVPEPASALPLAIAAIAIARRPLTVLVADRKPNATVQAHHH